MGNDAPAAVMATTGKISTMVDGTMRIVVEIAPAQAKLAFDLFGFPGTPVALARITPEASTDNLRKEAEKGPHGQAYAILYRHGFWFAHALHDALGIRQDIDALKASGASPTQVSDRVKRWFYDNFGITSMTNVEPARLRRFLQDEGIEYLLPSDFV